MKILHLAAITVSIFLTLFVTSQAYAPCIEGYEINCNGYPTHTLSQIHFDKLNYETQDKPIIALAGVPSTAVHLEIDDSSSNIMFEHDLTLSSNGTTRYILDISYYKSGGYSATATSLMSKVTTGFTVGMTPSGGNMHLGVDKNSYLPGDQISILGTGNSNTLIQLSLIDPSGTSIRSAKIFSDKTGHFSSSNFTIPNNAVSGIWQIGATGGIMHVRTQIVVNSTNNQSGINTDTIITPSPLQQFKSGVAANEVQCNDDLQLIFKTEGNFPACVKTTTAFHLSDLGWGYLPSPFMIKTDLLNSTISGGKIKEFQYDIPSRSIIIKIQTTSDGSLMVTIPKFITDLNPSDKPFEDFHTVLADGMEENVDIVPTSTGSSFTIPFVNGTQEIEIIGNHVGMQG